jgi:phosphonate transport system substrate-binding protein
MPPSDEKRRIHLPLFALIASVFAIAAFGIIIYLQIQTLSQERINASNDLSLKLIGLTRPVVNKLAASYTDTTGNLVADAPTDPAKQIDPDVLNISYVATKDPQQFRDGFKELMDHLSQATGKSVQYILIDKTDDELKDLRDGKLQIGGFSTGTVPLAVDASGFVPVCRLGAAAAAGYHMLIIVPASSPMTQLSDLKDHELGVTEPSSNSGYKAALVLLSQDVGLLPGRDFTLRFSGEQDASIAHIADGSYQSAAVASDVLDRAVAGGRIKQSAFRVIYSSELFPTAALGYAYNLKPELAAKISAALLDFDWKGTGLEKLFGPGGETKFIPVNYKNDWALVRRIDDAMGDIHILK